MAIRIAKPDTAHQAEIADRALALIGTPFRLHGRSVDAGLDCVGVVAHCIALAGSGREVPIGYRLRGDHEGLICAYFDGPRFRAICGDIFQAGDVAAAQPGARQFHLAVITQFGAVHAHMGLGRVVLTRLPLPWPITGHWRLVGD